DLPDFPAVAEKIYALLQNGDTLVCGHATGNDVKYLNLESRRFSLPPFRFEFADTQYVYMCRKKDMKRQYKLETIAEELGVGFTPHRAVDDAYATMKIAEAMCKAEGVSLRELLKKYGVTCGKIENYTITPVSSAAGKREKEEAKKRKERREKALAEFHRAADLGARRRNKNGALKSVSVCFSHRVEEDNERAFPLLFALYKAGAKYVYKPAACDWYVCFAGESGARRKSAEEVGAKICTPEELRAALETAANARADGDEKTSE
ncbi:MAG: exonuclease domain-containing protein, partial [Candidatus Scatosoma sp.]